MIITIGDVMFNANDHYKNHIRFLRKQFVVKQVGLKMIVFVRKDDREIQVARLNYYTMAEGTILVEVIKSEAYTDGDVRVSEFRRKKTFFRRWKQ